MRWRRILCHADEIFALFQLEVREKWRTGKPRIERNAEKSFMKGRAKVDGGAHQNSNGCMRGVSSGWARENC